MAETETTGWTAEAIAAAGLDPRRYEVSGGRLVDRAPDARPRPGPPEPRRAEVAGGALVPRGELGLRGGRSLVRLARALLDHVEAEALGVVCAGFAVRFRLAEEPRIERMPDLSFVALDRVPDPEPDFVFPGAPDLAVEFLSRTDSAYDLGRKARELFAHETREAWLVDPVFEVVTVLRPGERARPLGSGDVLGSGLLPGFALPLADLFAPLAR